MSKKVLKRIVPCTRVEFKKLRRQVEEAIRLSSTHDPDHVKAIKSLSERLDRLTDHVNREIGVAQDVPLHMRLEQ